MTSGGLLPTGAGDWTVGRQDNRGSGGYAGDYRRGSSLGRPKKQLGQAVKTALCHKTAVALRRRLYLCACWAHRGFPGRNGELHVANPGTECMCLVLRRGPSF